MTHSDETTTIAQLRELMRVFVAERHWEKYHNPKNLAVSAAVEAGELLELFQWLDTEEARTRAGGEEAFRKAVGEELSDVLLYLLSLANSMDLDVSTIVHAKMVKNRKKYPAEQFKGHYQRPLPE